jgi:TPR repeat protein
MFVWTKLFVWKCRAGAGAVVKHGLLQAVLSLVLMLSPSVLRAEGRWALVVGVAQYQSASIPGLENTLNDARTMSAALNNMGFRVYLVENATRAAVSATIAQIGVDVPDADLGFFFFAGHGVQIGGTNYLLTAEIDPAQPDFLTKQGLTINSVLSDLTAIRPQKLVVVLDSCRNSPFGVDQAYGTGMALLDAPENALIAYSTAPGAVALDGTNGNSPYTAALASALDGPQQDIRDVLRYVRAKVRLATGGTQTPWFVDNTRAEIVIQPRDPVPLDPDLAARLDGDISLLSTTWKTIATSSDPRDFELFAKLHPEDQLAEVALRQVTLLRQDDRPILPPMDLGVPDPNPDVPGGLGSVITECDVLATGPGDVMGLVSPVPHDLVNIRAALRACTNAVTNEPESARLLGLLARVLRLDDRFEEARFYYEKAAALGNPTANGGLSDIHRYGLGVPSDKVKSADYARRGAMMGAAPLQVLVAMHYREGWGVPQSFSEARRWLEISANSGYASGITALGDLYQRGQGVPKDPAQAFEFYRQAAALGKTDAMNNIGIGYMRGEGVAEDLGAGIWWLSRASEQGNPYAPYHLGRAFQKGWGVKQDARQALAYFRLSAQRNFLGGYLYIAGMLESGDGVERNLPEAYANYRIAIEAAKARDTIAAQKEQAEAEAKLADLTPRMSEAEVATGQKIAQDWIDQYGLLDFNLVNQ